MKNITVVAIDFLWHDLTRYAIEASLKNIDPTEVIIISDREILPGARHIIREPVTGMPDYANLMLKGVSEYINTSHALYVQWDGIANDRTQWNDAFLQYDYIGAPWPWEPEGKNIGNGGFSLRSKRLLDACLDNHIKLTEADPVAEDKIIGNINREYLEQVHAIKFSPTTVARQFSYELGRHEPSFGFHGLWNVFNLMSDADMDYYISRIDYTGWNIYKWHHVLTAVIRRDRLDLYEIMIGHLVTNSPELIHALAQWIVSDGQIQETNLVIN